MPQLRDELLAGVRTGAWSSCDGLSRARRHSGWSIAYGCWLPSSERTTCKYGVLLRTQMQEVPRNSGAVAASRGDQEDRDGKVKTR
jgi:hypothetical protein